MAQSINTTAKAACLQAAPAFQLPAVRARPAAGPGEHSPAAAPGARPACLAPPDPKHCAVGWRGAAPGARWGRGTPRAHQRRTSSTAALAPIRMRYACAAAAGMPRTRCSTPIRILRTSEGAPGVCAAGAPKRGAGGAAGDAGVVGGKSTRAHTPGRATAHARGPAPAHTFGFDQPHWARTSRLGRPVLIG